MSKRANRATRRKQAKGGKNQRQRSRQSRSRPRVKRQAKSGGSKRSLVVVAALALLAAVGVAFSVGGGPGTDSTSGAKVEQVIDGDTIRLEDGRRVRLVQIDTPELSESECYAQQARAALERYLPEGSEVRLQRDRRLDESDRFGRKLRYVVKDGRNLNLALVRQGAAAPWFVDGDRGRLAGRFVNAAKHARAGKRGLWDICPRTRLDTTRGVEAVR